MRITRAHWDDSSRTHATTRRTSAALSSAKDGVVEGVFRAENPRKSPYGYELDHRSLFAANELDDEGFEVGIYHSHPRSPRRAVAAPTSNSDLSALALRDHLGGAEPVVRVWHIADGRVEEEELDVLDKLTNLCLPECGRVDDTGASFCPSCGMPLVCALARVARGSHQRGPRTRSQDRPLDDRGRARAVPGGATRPRTS